MKEYKIIARESYDGLDIRVAEPDEGCPQGCKELGTLKAKNLSEAARLLKQRLIHTITERWVSL